MTLELKNRNCPACSSSEHTVIGKPGKVDDLFKSLECAGLDSVRIVRCGRCSLLYTYPFPYFSDELLRKMYSIGNNYFPELTDRMEIIIHRDNPARRFETARRYAQQPIKKFLEIGCGQGFGLQAALARGWNVSGQDVSPDFARIVKDRTGIDILVGPLRSDSFPADAFDFIYIDSVLEHVPNPAEFLSLTHSFLAPGGVIYLTLPNEGSFPNTCMDFLFSIKGSKVTSRTRPFSEPYHTLGFTKRSITCLGKATGFSVPFLKCRHSFGHLERFKRPFSLSRTLTRVPLALLYLLSDGLNNGMNMEVVFVKKSTR